MKNRKDNVLADFLKHNRKAVQNMLTAIWDYEVEKKVIREEALTEGRQEGLSQGLSQGRQETLQKVVSHMYREGFSVEQIVKGLGLPEQDVKKILGL